MSKPTVMITGAGIGIGEATALAFGRAGYHVYVTDMLDEEGQGTVAAIEAEGGSASFSHVDVTDTANVDDAVAAAEAATGPLDAAIANAGIAHKVLLSGYERREVGPHSRCRPHGCVPPAARRGAGDARGEAGRHGRGLVGHGHHMGLARPRAVQRRQGRRRGPRARAGLRSSAATASASTASRPDSSRPRRRSVPSTRSASPVWRQPPNTSRSAVTARPTTSPT